MSCTNKQEENNMFYNNWADSPTEGAFKMQDWIIWGGLCYKSRGWKILYVCKPVGQKIIDECMGN